MMAFFQYLFRLFLSPLGLVGLAALDSSMLFFLPIAVDAAVVFYLPDIRTLFGLSRYLQRLVRSSGHL